MPTEADLPDPHYVCTVTDTPDHLLVSAQAWLRHHVRLVVSRQVVVHLPWDSLAADIDADPDWQGWMDTDTLIALNRRAGLLLQARRHGADAWDADTPAAADHTVRLTVTGGRAAVSDWLAQARQRYATQQPVIHWVHNAESDEVMLPVREDLPPHPAMFPFLPQPLHAVYDAFAQADAPVLLLIGPPGTGKTSFIRGYLQHRRVSALVSYDPQVLQGDDLFARFMRGDTPVFVLEDADHHLRARDTGGDASLMHCFLSISDGLVSARGKKLIFSTNLPSVKDVDPALLRPGRCFAVLSFRALTPPEAATLQQGMGLGGPAPSADCTLAELLQPQGATPVLPTRPVGFV